MLTFLLKLNTMVCLIMRNYYKRSIQFNKMYVFETFVAKNKNLIFLVPTIHKYFLENMNKRSFNNIGFDQLVSMTKPLYLKYNSRPSTYNRLTQCVCY